jgi:hypothetical protein
MAAMILRPLSLLCLSAALALAGDGWRNPEKMRVPPVNELDATFKVPEALPPISSVTPSFSPALGDTIGWTDYDYGWGGGSRTMVDTYFPGQPAGSRAQFVFMERNSTLPGTAGRRGLVYVYYDGTRYTVPRAVVPRDRGSTGFGDISVFRSTQAHGLAAVPSHAPPRLSINTFPGDTAGWVAGEIPLPRPASPGDPVSAIRGRSDTLFVVVSGADRSDYWVMRTTDFGTSWRFMDSLAKYVGTGWAADVMHDPPFQVAPNGDLYVFGGATTGGGGNHLPPLGTATTANADRMGYWRSTDQGATWTWNPVILDGSNPLTSKPREFFVCENFGQVDGIVDARGNVHMVFNGYGFDFARPDSAEVFRVLYWNSFMNTWMDLSRDTLNRPPYVTAAFRSGNAIGRPYPTIAIDSTGSHVMAAWSEPQTSAANPVDTTNGVYVYDIWYRFSMHHGGAWVSPVNLTATPNRTELFATFGKEITTTSYGWRLGHLVYLSEARANAGCYDCGEGPRSDSPWMYRTTTAPTGVGYGDELPSNYSLEQNYPNPFNPSTVLSYTLPVSGRVSLKVFNVLGEEVASLVNEEKAAGSYKVNFDGANLASGVYFYTLRAGGFTATKKMLLTK